MSTPHFMSVWRSYVASLETVPLDTQLLRVSDMAADDSRHFAPTVYMHIVGKKLMYVGQSINVSHRRRQHSQTRFWDDEYVLTAPDEMQDYPLAQRWMNATETALIQHLSPPINVHKIIGGIVSQDIYNHVKARGFHLPNGITVGEPQMLVVTVTPRFTREITPAPAATPDTSPLPSGPRKP